MLKFRKLMLVLTFVVSLVFVTIMGATYAYYNNTFGNIDISTGNKDDMINIIFRDSDYLDLHTGIPILPEEVEMEASKISFSLNPNNNITDGYDVSTSIYLSDIEIDDELKTSDFKYRLVCNNKVTYNDGTFNVGNNQTFEGNFIDLKSSYLNITNLSSSKTGNEVFLINYGDNIVSQKYECTLYIWLQESLSSQNNLMNRHFATNISVDSVIAKR